MLSESSTGSWAELQLQCSLSKEGDPFYNLPPQTVYKFKISLLVTRSNKQSSFKECNFLFQTTEALRHDPVHGAQVPRPDGEAEGRPRARGGVPPLRLRAPLAPGREPLRRRESGPGTLFCTVVSFAKLT